MSCVQVMYQPYGGYLSYDRMGASRMQEDKKYPIHNQHNEEPVGYIRNIDPSLTTSPQVIATPVPSGGSTSSSCATPANPTSPQKPEERTHPVIQVASPTHLYERKKEESTENDETDERKEMRYLSANCVLFTNYVGDSATVVEEHFSRALSQPSYETKGVISKVSSPMTQRNFPPSFWNGNYQQPSSRNLSGYGLHPHSSHDFYNSMAEAYHHSLHPQLGQDPWSHYQLSSQAYFAASAYGGVANNRFGSQYGSLLLHQPGPSTSRLGPAPSTSHCPTVKTEPWNGRYSDSLGSSDLGADHGASAYSGAAHTYSGVGALEGSSGLQEYPKDLYWF